MCPPQSDGWKNLKPNPGGEVRNPTGRNQYTARREAEKAWDQIALAVRGDSRRLDAFLEKVWDHAEKGDSWAAKEVLVRLVPVITKIELPPSEPKSHRFVPGEDEQRQLRGEMRGNGHDTESPLH